MRCWCSVLLYAIKWNRHRASSDLNYNMKSDFMAMVQYKFPIPLHIAISSSEFYTSTHHANQQATAHSHNVHLLPRTHCSYASQCRRLSAVQSILCDNFLACSTSVNEYPEWSLDFLYKRFLIRINVILCIYLCFVPWSVYAIQFNVKAFVYVQNVNFMVRKLMSKSINNVTKRIKIVKLTITPNIVSLPNQVHVICILFLSF